MFDYVCLEYYHSQSHNYLIPDMVACYYHKYNEWDFLPNIAVYFLIRCVIFASFSDPCMHVDRVSIISLNSNTMW